MWILPFGRKKPEKPRKPGTRVHYMETGETLGEWMNRYHQYLSGEMAYEEFKKGPKGK